MSGIIKQNKNKRSLLRRAGFTLIETLIAVSIFSMVIVIALDSFIKIIKFNRQSVQAQDLQDNVRFLYESMSKEIKTAIKDDGNCNSFFSNQTGLSGIDNARQVYSTMLDGNDNNVLFFRNYHGQCVIYYLAKDDATGNQRLKIIRSQFGDYTEGQAYVLPAEISVSKLSVDVQGNFDAVRHTPYSVTLYMHLKNVNWDPSDFDIQTTLTSRYIE
jgi:prepilin-type N-terminal cleavage/methylation domain-containing protein